MRELARSFSVITLGGRHLGGVAALEDRARAPTYQAMFRTLVDLMAPKPGETLLDVGCGSGALDRLLARRLGAGNSITAVDVNPFLLEEAAVLAKAESVERSIRFAPGRAEALPFGDAAFDCVFSVTVLEECDADRALREMVRVTRPGGRIVLMESNSAAVEAQLVKLVRRVRRNASRMVQAPGGIEFWAEEDGHPVVTRIAHVPYLLGQLERHGVRPVKRFATEFFDINRFAPGLRRDLVIRFNRLWLALRLPPGLSVGNGIIGHKG